MKKAESRKLLKGGACSQAEKPDVLFAEEKCITFTLHYMEGLTSPEHRALRSLYGPGLLMTHLKRTNYFAICEKKNWVIKGLLNFGGRCQRIHVLSSKTMLKLTKYIDDNDLSQTLQQHNVTAC